MKKEEIIKRYGSEEYKRRLTKNRARTPAQRDVAKAIANTWHTAHPEEAKIHNDEISLRCGKRYKKHLEYMRSGLPGERHKIRTKHGKPWSKYKKIIAPGSQIHHEWIPKTAKYRGVALVETGAHRYGIVDVIQILKGEITLLTEEKNRR